MAINRNGSLQLKQIKSTAAKTYRRSPYREHTRVIRVPESLLPRLQNLLTKFKEAAADSA